MRGRAAFGLVDLLIIIGILIVLAAFLMPVFQNVRELAKGPSCKSNISAIGKSLAIYASANKDQFPWLVSNNQWDAATGASRFASPSTTTNCNLSALLFALVRDGQGPDIFICPKTKDVRDPNVKSSQGFNWDFSPFSDGRAEHVSYSYQAPRPDSNGGWGSGVTSDSNAMLVILADKTPTYDGKNATFDWASPGAADLSTGMSQNHSKGEMINLLFADLHVGESIGRADVGVRNDNIYSAAGLGADGNALDTNRGPGSLKLSDHRSERDSFLLGPKKMEK